MRSRPWERVLDEVGEAVRSGYREVQLLGQNVNSYGTDQSDGVDFVSLLERVAEAGPERIRFTSSHPRDVDDRLFEAMASLPAVMPHIHAACQSGSDRILATMNRGTTQARLLEMVKSARRIVRGINFTTDIIVGFPGETEDDFLQTLDLIDEARFGSIFAAKYSPRPGTASVRLEDDVTAEEKDDRLQRLLTRQRAIAWEENRRLVGDEVEVLIDGKGSDGGVFGRAPDHRTVTVAAHAEPGSIVRVCVTDASAAALRGEPVELPEAIGSVRKERP